MEKRVLILVLLVFCFGGVLAGEYYVDADADAGGDGTTTATTGPRCAFKTLKDVHDFLLNDANNGDTIRFQRGDVWKFDTDKKDDPYNVDWFSSSIAEGVLDIVDQNITIGAYGSGDRPIIDGGETWTDISPYRDNFSSGDSIILIGRNGNADGFTLEDIEFRNFGSATIKNWNRNYITIQRCKATYMGDMFFRVFQGRNHDIRIFDNEAGYLGQRYLYWEPYAGWANGISLQTNEADSYGPYNMHVKGNYIYKVMGEGMGIPFADVSGGETIVENNIVVDSASPAIHVAPKAWNPGKLTVRYNLVAHTGDANYKRPTHYAPGMYLMDEYTADGDNSEADVEYYGNIYINWANNMVMSSSISSGNIWGKLWVYNNLFIQPKNFNILLSDNVFSRQRIRDFRFYNNSVLELEGVNTRAHTYIGSNNNDYTGTIIEHNYFYPYNGVGSGSYQVDSNWDSNMITGDPKLPSQSSVDWSELGSIYNLDFSRDIYPSADSPLNEIGITKNFLKDICEGLPINLGCDLGDENIVPEENEVMVIHYTMDSADISSGRVLDKSGNGNDATIFGNPEISVGKVSESLYFDGLDDYLDSGYVDQLNQWTVLVWTKPKLNSSSLQDSGPVMKQQNFLISTDHSSSVFRNAAGISVGGSWYASSFGVVEADKWNYLVASYDGESLKAYRNGELISVNDNPSGVSDVSPDSMKVARHAVKDYFYRGYVDELRVYNYALSDSEILGLYDGFGVCVSFEDVALAIESWRGGATSINNILEVVGRWKRGC